MLASNRCPCLLQDPYQEQLALPRQKLGTTVYDGLLRTNLGALLWLVDEWLLVKKKLTKKELVRHADPADANSEFLSEQLLIIWRSETTSTPSEHLKNS